MSSLLSPSSSITFYFAGDNSPWEVIRTTKTDYESNFCHPSVALQVLQFGTKKSLKTLNYLEITFPSLIHLKFPGKRCLLPPPHPLPSRFNLATLNVLCMPLTPENNNRVNSVLELPKPWMLHTVALARGDVSCFHVKHSGMRLHIPGPIMAIIIECQNYF